MENATCFVNWLWESYKGHPTERSPPDNHNLCTGFGILPFSHCWQTTIKLKKYLCFQKVNFPNYTSQLVVLRSSELQHHHIKYTGGLASLSVGGLLIDTYIQIICFTWGTLSASEVWKKVNGILSFLWKDNSLANRELIKWAGNLILTPIWLSSSPEAHNSTVSILCCLSSLKHYRARPI